MALLLDTNHFYNKTVEHDYKMNECAFWVEHYNFLLGLKMNTKEENLIYKEELVEYLCYDV